MKISISTHIVWGLARALVWLFYRIERFGEDAPDGPAVLVANHSNGLLDPSLIVATSRRQPRFLAKSTLFSMPVISWFVRGAGSIPVYRRGDTGADASRNEETFRDVHEALGRGEVVCLFPEGISHSSGRIEPLRTGAARMVLGASREGARVAVVPVGLNFDHKAAFRSTVLVAYGRAFWPDAWVDQYARDEAGAVRGLTQQIEEHLRNVVVEVEPTQDADLVKRVEHLYAAARRLPRSTDAVLERRRRIAAGMDALRSRDAQRYALLYEQLRKYERRRARFGLAEGGYLRDVPFAAAVRFAARETLAALVLGPVALAGALVFAIPYQVVRAFSWVVRAPLDQVATAKIFASVVFYILWVGLLTTLAWRWTGGGAALLTAVGLPILGLATLFAIERETAVLEIARTYLASRWTPDTTEVRLMRHRAAIADLLDETNRWLER